ncbi:transglutaminase family protein [Niabella digestorum]|jgi:Transglutaminase-like enzymes, putative cysteine proteases|uniref:Transglutaminase family protein n=1 Tax=Niabella digestorum TaxID=3117701 RepID=A0ABU7RHV0_9BACT
MPAYNVKHITRYSYGNPVVECANQIKLYPINDGFQNVLRHKITITKNPNVEVFTDFFGNQVGVFTIVEPLSELQIVSEAEVVTHEIQLPEIESPADKQWGLLREACERLPYIDFLQKEHLEEEENIKSFIHSLYDEQRTPFENARIFSEYIFKNFEYKKGVTSVETSVDEIWRLKAGVCQDFAHFLLWILRYIGIPARYVSGYICPKDHEFRGEGATHAWVEAYVPDYGWVGLDPTNNCIASDRHIRLAVGRNFSDCTPVKGTYKGSSDHVLEVSVSIYNKKEVAEAGDVVANPIFAYRSSNLTDTSLKEKKNSYRYYMEQIQQQQQQQ